MNRVAACGMLLLVALSIHTSPARADERIDAIWLTCDRPILDRVVVNWVSDEPGESELLVRRDGGQIERFVALGSGHHYRAAIPLDGASLPDHLQYCVRTGPVYGPWSTLAVPAGKQLRVAVVANWHRHVSLRALEADRPHLLLTAGDNIPNLYERCGSGRKDCIKPYVDLVRAYPELFRQVIFLPVLGNHDKQIRPRGAMPPEEPVYDVSATAFRRAFPLPEPGWHWSIKIPEFQVRFTGLDLHHTRDMGTTWQSCHEFDSQSEQFRWYAKLMGEDRTRYRITLYNAQNAAMRSLAGGIWQPLLQKNTLCIAGFGHFAEMAEVDGVPYFNTSLVGTGDRYRDPRSRFLASEDNYLLLILDRTQSPPALSMHIKNLQGKTLYSWKAR